MPRCPGSGRYPATGGFVAKAYISTEPNWTKLELPWFNLHSTA